MSKRSDDDSLHDIQEAIQRIESYIAGMDYSAFLADRKTQDAVIRNLEIMGEAARNLSPELRAQYPAIPWKNVVGARDRLIHAYFGVNLDVVWQIVETELPQMAGVIHKILEEGSR